MGWMKNILLVFVVLAVSVAKSVETADFMSGTGTNGWVVSVHSYVSPAYPNSIREIVIESAGSGMADSAVVYARTRNGGEMQVAAFTAMSPSVTLSFAEGAGFNSLRIETSGGLAISSVSVSLFSSLRGFPVSELSDGVYAQDFDSLAEITSTSGNKDWLNGTTLPYWQAWKGGDAVTSISYNGGKIRVGGLYALASDQKESLRALGGYSSKDAAVVWGMALTNDTDVAVKVSGISYRAQQWGFANTGVHMFSCSLLVTNRIDWIENLNGGWRSCCETEARVFGNDETHPVPVESEVKVASGIAPRIKPGEVLMLKWTIQQPANGYSALMAIDDLEVTIERYVRPFSVRLVDGGGLMGTGWRMRESPVAECRNGTEEERIW